MEEPLYEEFNKLEEIHWWFQARKKILLRLIDKYYQPSPGSKVLDIGCGTGMTLRCLSKYGKTWGMDKDIRAVEYSRNKVPEANIVAGFFPDEAINSQFDLITILDVLEHIEDDERALNTASGLLKPGGFLVVAVPAYQWLWTAHDTMNQHQRRYKIGELKAKVIKAGLEIKKISYYNSILFLPIATAKLWRRFFLKNKNNSHLEGGLPPQYINSILQEIFSLERYLLLYFNFLFGISIIAIAEKKE